MINLSLFRIRMDSEITVNLQSLSGQLQSVRIQSTATIRSLIGVANLDINNSTPLMLHNGRCLNFDLSLMSQGVNDSDTIVYYTKRRKQLSRYFDRRHKDSICLSKFVTDIFGSFLRNSDLAYITVDADRDANCFYTKVLEEEAQNEDLCDIPYFPIDPTDITPAVEISTKPLPQPWEERVVVKEKSTAKSTPKRYTPRRRKNPRKTK